MMKEKKILKIAIFFVSVLFFVNLILLGYFLFFQFTSTNYFKNNNLKVIFLNVGQGEAILIQTPNHLNILIDGGPNRQIVYKLDKYIPLTNRKIDIMILTHPDPDHLNGLVEVLKRYQVNQVIYTGVSDPDPSYLEWKRVIQEKNISKIIIDRKQLLKIDDQIYLEFLWPKESLVNRSFKDDNFASIVSRLIFNQIKILFTGDAPKEVEEELIKIENDLTADILKVAHHGSKSSTGFKFLERVKPKYAIISVGRNTFGHPSFRVLNNLEKIGAKILRTDERGDIIFFTDGKELEFK